MNLDTDTSAAPTDWNAPIALAALVIVALVSLFWLSHPYYTARPDGSMYVLTARSMLQGEGYTYMGIPVIVRPPGFSALLVPVIALFGTNYLAMNLYTDLYGILCVALLLLYLRPRLGLVLSFVISLAVWFNPEFQRLCNVPFSDLPCAGLILLCLLVARWAREIPGPRRDAVLGLLIGLTTYVRTVAVLLIPAILLSRLFGQSPQPLTRRVRSTALSAAVIVSIVFAVSLPWSLRNLASEPDAPVEEFWAHSYSVGMFHVDPGDPGSRELSWGEVLGRAPSAGQRLTASLGRWMWTGLPTVLHGLAGLLTLIFLVGLLIWRRRTTEFYALGNFALLSIYFAYGERLLLPIYLFAFPAVVEIVKLAFERVMAARTATIATVVLILVPAAIAVRLPDTGKLALDQQQRAELSAFLDQHYPGVPLAATVGRHLTVGSARPVYSLKYPAKRGGRKRVQEIIEARDIAVVAIDRKERFARQLMEILESRYPVRHDLGRFVVFDTSGVAR